MQRRRALLFVPVFLCSCASETVLLASAADMHASTPELILRNENPNNSPFWDIKIDDVYISVRMHNEVYLSGDKAYYRSPKDRVNVTVWAARDASVLKPSGTITFDNGTTLNPSTVTKFSDFCLLGNRTVTPREEDINIPVKVKRADEADSDFMEKEDVSQSGCVTYEYDTPINPRSNFSINLGAIRSSKKSERIVTLSFRPGLHIVRHRAF